jgi:hypothetical protein
MRSGFSHFDYLRNHGEIINKYIESHNINEQDRLLFNDAIEKYNELAHDLQSKDISLYNRDYIN